MENQEKLLPIPQNMQLEEDRNSMKIIHKWSNIMGYILLGFSLFWNSIIYFGFISEMLAENVPTFVLFFMTPFIGVGIFIFYFGLANILNTTIISIGYDNVSVKHTPLPWLGNKDIFKHDIKQLYVKQHISKGKNGTSMSYSTSISYSVNLIDKDNKDIKLIDSLQTPDEGRFIEQKIEKFLKIQSKPVSGEYNG